MRDVTNALLNYREATRHVWNTYFLERVSSLRECGALDHFEQIDRHLFHGLVLEELGKTAKQFDAFRQEPIPFLRIRPKERESTPLVVGDASNGASRVWNDETPIVVSSFELEFIEFFEWDRYGNLSLPYLRGRIVDIASHRNLLGRECLVEVHRAKVLFAG